jgi:hypothetical protein
VIDDVEAAPRCGQSTAVMSMKAWNARWVVAQMFHHRDDVLGLGRSVSSPMVWAYGVTVKPSPPRQRSATA